MDEQLIERQQKLLSSKQIFDVELTTNCNKKCYCCPRDKFKRTNSTMTEETFAKLCDWLPKDCSVFFAGFGEPLLHSSCIPFIRRLHNSGRGTSIMTNGITLNSETIAKLFDSGLDKLQISIIQKTDLNQIYDFIAIILPEYKNRVIFNIIKEKEMIPAMKEIEFLTKNGWYFCEKLIHNRAGHVYDAQKNDELTTCATFFCDTFINTQGQIHVCSNDINGDYIIDSIWNMSFSELIEYKKRYFGNKEICLNCNHCNDEYRLKHFEEIL